MRNLIILLGIFVLMVGVNLNFTSDAEAGISMPYVSATLVCHYNNFKKTYNVVQIDLGGYIEEECGIPEYCDNNETCADCLTALSSWGYDIDKSNKVTNNRVVYTLNANYLDIDCPGSGDDDDDTGTDGP